MPLLPLRRWLPLKHLRRFYAQMLRARATARQTRSQRGSLQVAAKMPLHALALQTSLSDSLMA